MELVERMSATFEHLAAQREVRQSQRDYYDAHQHSVVLQANDFVLLYKPARQVGLATKLLTHWSSPFKVVQPTRVELYLIEDQNTGVRQTAHTQRLALYTPYSNPTAPPVLPVHFRLQRPRPTQNRRYPHCK